MSISACLIVKNEEKNLGRLLPSLSQIMDEIIVVDTGSSDKSLEVAKQYAAKTESFAWVDDFSAARNFAESFATKDWILSIDADELLDESNFKKLQDLIKESKADAYRLLQRNYTNESQLGSWQPLTGQAKERAPDEAKAIQGFIDNPMPKLHRRNPEIQWEGLVHETFLPSCRALGLRIEDAPIILDHFGWNIPSEELEQKQDYYFKLAAEKLARAPDDAKAWHEVAVAATHKELFDQAEKAYFEAAKLRPDWAEPVYNRSLILLRLERYEEAESLLRELLSKDAPNQSYLAALSTAVLYQGKLEETEEVLKKVLSGPEPHPFEAHINAGTLQFELKNFEEAAVQFKAAQALRKDDEFVKAALAKCQAALNTQRT